MRKILLSFIALFTMFFCVMSAEAWQPNYTAYEAGNEIEVVLGKGLKAKFYVMEDSNSESGTVTAIYKDVLGEAFYFGPTKASIVGSTAKTKLDELTKDWETPNEIRLIDVSEINDEIDTSSEEEYEFTKPVYLNIGKSYWTQTVINNGETYRPYLVTTWNTFSTLHTTQSNSPSNGGYIRPVIEIEKEYINNGVVKPKNWEELVDFYSNVIIEAEFELKTVKTENSLYAKLTDNEWADEANFDLVDNLLTYKAVYKEGDTPILSEFMFECVIYWDAFRIVYDGYFIDGTFQLTINEPYLTVIRDDNNRITEMTADLETLLGWKVESEEEIKIDDTKTEETKKEEIKEEVKNPKTADTNVILVTLGLIASGSLIVISKKKLCKNK